MKTVMLLLVSIVGMLLRPAFANPTRHRSVHNLNSIIDLAKKYNDSLSKQIFVEDVSDLADGRDGCGNTFFCKVQEILENHAKKFMRKNKKNPEMELLENLNVFINSTNVNCTETLTQVTPSVQTKPLPVLVGFLSDCCKQNNLISV